MYFEKKSTLVSYIPMKNKNFYGLSIMHLDDVVVNETGELEIIFDYNKTNGVVDSVDKLCSAYNCARIKRLSPMVIFYRKMNVAGVIYFVMYKHRNPEQNFPKKNYL